MKKKVPKSTNQNWHEHCHCHWFYFSHFFSLGGGQATNERNERSKTSGVSEIMAPNNFGSALSKAALKGPLKGSLKGPLKAVIGRLQLISWTSCGVIKSKPRRRRRRRRAAAAVVVAIFFIEPSMNVGPDRCERNPGSVDCSLLVRSIP